VSFCPHPGEKIFWDEDPIGKHLAVNDEQQLIEVTGGLGRYPATPISFDMLCLTSVKNR